MDNTMTGTDMADSPQEKKRTCHHEKEPATFLKEFADEIGNTTKAARMLGLTGTGLSSMLRDNKCKPHYNQAARWQLSRLVRSGKRKDPHENARWHLLGLSRYVANTTALDMPLDLAEALHKPLHETIRRTIQEERTNG